MTRVYAVAAARVDPGVIEVGDIDSGVVVLTLDNGVIATVDRLIGRSGCVWPGRVQIGWHVQAPGITCDCYSSGFYRCAGRFSVRL